MQVNAINNSNLGFKSAHPDNIDRATAFVNMDDSQLRLYSELISRDPKEDRKQAKKISKAFWAIPIVDTLASALLVVKNSHLGEEVNATLRKAPLSVRADAALGTAALWGVTLGTIGIYSFAKKKISNHSENLQRFERKNPLLSFIADVGVVCGAMFLGMRGILSALYHSAIKHPENYEDAIIKTNNLAEKIDNSKLNKTYLTKMADMWEHVAKDAPAVAKASRYLLANSVWILVGVGILDMFRHSNKQDQKVEKNYKILKQKQLEVAKYLANEQVVERDVLAQGKPHTAKEVRNTMSNTQPPSDEELSEAEEIETDD